MGEMCSVKSLPSSREVRSGLFYELSWIVNCTKMQNVQKCSKNCKLHKYSESFHGGFALILAVSSAYCKTFSVVDCELVDGV